MNLQSKGIQVVIIADHYLRVAIYDTWRPDASGCLLRIFLYNRTFVFYNREID